MYTEAFYTLTLGNRVFGHISPGLSPNLRINPQAAAETHIYRRRARVRRVFDITVFTSEGALFVLINNKITEKCMNLNTLDLDFVLVLYIRLFISSIFEQLL